MTQSAAASARLTLPVEFTHFVGRERELAALRELVGTARLLTLTGAGGSGKSRLALELVPDIQAHAPDGIAWVALAPLTDAELVPGAVLEALGVPTEGAAATLDAILAALRGRRMALVLDNCEHLVDSCATLADTLLRSLPDLRVVATSREALGVGGERAWLVPPLRLPEPNAPLELLAAADAVQLFTERARDVLPDFALTRENAAAVVDICTRLDGIPLAIELAAARVRHLSPEQIRQRLSDAFALLTTGSRTALPRHRTLRAAVDWSHDLLREEARVVLRRLALFRGGFSLDTAERVAAGGAIAVGDVVDLIGVLADRSMIVVREQGGLARYHLLETMRQYALQRLEEAGEAEGVRRRFAEAITSLVAAAEPAFTTTRRREAFAQLDPELDNIRETLAWTQEHDGAQHVRLVGMLWWYWFSTRHWVEAHRWITGALALPEAQQRNLPRAALLFAAGALGALRAQSDAARPLLAESIELAASLGCPRLEAYALNYMAMTYAATLSPRAAEFASRSEPWLRTHGDAYGLRLSLLLQGMAARGAGDIPAARTMMEEAVQIARSFGHDRELAIALQTLGSMLLETNEPIDAEGILRESLEALQRDPSFLFIARGIEYHAAPFAQRQPARAAHMLGVAEAVRRHIGANPFPHDARFTGALTQRLRTALGDEAYERAFQEGLLVPPSAALSDVLGGAAPATAPASPPALTPPKSRAETAAPGAASAPQEPADIELRTLGRFQVIVRGEVIDAWPYAKPRELLVFLALQPGGRTRGEIGEALWPGASAAQVRNNFHVTMHHLRRTLGHADWVVVDGEHYRIAPSLRVELDVARFEREASAAIAAQDAPAVPALRAALALYRDHFLAAETTGPWREAVQDRTRRLFSDAGYRLGNLLAQAGDHAAAADAFQQVVTHEPLHEPAHRGLLLALARSGNRVHALRHYHRLAALLEQLDLEPEPETEALCERIRRADVTLAG